MTLALDSLAVGSLAVGSLALLLGSLCLAVVADSQPSPVPPGSVAVRLDRLFSDQDSGLHQRRRDVIVDDGQWRATWTELTRPRTSADRPPAVDFTRSLVILAAMGARPTGGSTITIEAVYRGQGRLWVVVREESPSAECLTSQALTAPAEAVSVSRGEEPVTFVETRRAKSCG